jgi:hypothetical protein
MTLPDANPTRKQRFLAALGLAGLTLNQWCELHGVSRTHLYFVFEGDRVPSADLDAAIDATIEKYLRAASV